MILLGIDAAVGHSQAIGNAFSRKSWVTEVLIERLLANLQNGVAAQTLRKVWAKGKSVTPASANAIVNELVLAGLIEPRGLHGTASWDVSASRRNEVDNLWSALRGPEQARHPGLGTIATAMGVDAAAVLTWCSRVVTHDALYYGYNPRDPAEEVFMMQIIGFGLATTASAKVAAYQQLSILTRSLAINVAWRELSQQTFVKVAQKFATTNTPARQWVSAPLLKTTYRWHSSRE